MPRANLRIWLDATGSTPLFGWMPGDTPLFGWMRGVGGGKGQLLYLDGYLEGQLRYLDGCMEGQLLYLDGCLRSTHLF